MTPPDLTKAYNPKSFDVGKIAHLTKAPWPTRARRIALDRALCRDTILDGTTLTNIQEGPRPCNQLTEQGTYDGRIARNPEPLE
jgi:hypothetical protein